METPGLDKGKKKGRGHAQLLGEGDFGCVIRVNMEPLVQKYTISRDEYNDQIRMLHDVAQMDQRDAGRGLPKKASDYLIIPQHPREVTAPDQYERVLTTCPDLGERILRKGRASAPIMYMSDMPYAGTSLDDLLKRGIKLSSEETKQVEEDVYNALQHLYSHGFIHGDLHSRNVTYSHDSETKRVYLIDPKLQPIGKGSLDLEVNSYYTLILSTLADITEDGALRRQYKASASIVAKRVLSSLAQADSVIKQVKKRESSSPRSNAGKTARSLLGRFDSL